MLKEITLFGEIDKVQIAIDRLKFAAEIAGDEGLYLAFSGGKDSQCIYHLAKESGVKFDAHYNITGIDPPEVVKFIEEKYPDVKREMYEKSMYRLIIENGMPPTRLIRYCCRILKERGGVDRICVTGVRWEESPRRKVKRATFEAVGNSTKDITLLNDNDEDRRQFEVCMSKGKKIINPIIDWTSEDVWEYLNTNNIEHCCLYDEGFKRLGCIGCPMAGTRGREKEFNRYPGFKKYYIRAFDKMLEKRRNEGKKINENWQTGEDVFNWWVTR